MSLSTPSRIFLFAAGALGGILGAPRPAEAKGLIVHEWGTFTTLSASDGRPLGGLYVDASRLPAFVHGIPYFNYDAASGWAPMSKLRNVTVKMETPVLYFYSPTAVDVEVKVDFKGGTISQWYPQCHECEAAPTGPYVDFAAAPYPGHISWKAKVLAPGAAAAYTTSASGLETAEWTAPRNVASNLLLGEHGEYERFLFYRGLGNFPSTVKLAFVNDSTFTVSNDGDDSLPWVMVYDRPHAGEPTMQAAATWYQGPLAAHAKLTLKRGAAATQYDQATMSPMDSLLAHLVLAGLNLDEARALRNTWYTGYFIESGLKAFWILPRAQVDRILPLSITPAPEDIQRVIVGRSEILTPDFEAELRRARYADTLSAFAKDKYWLAYQEFLSSEGSALSLKPRAPWRAAGNGISPRPAARFDWPGTAFRDALGRLSP
jgi:hypothetical protein